MTGTWFDRLRGEGQGRSQPISFSAPDGEHVFILGADSVGERAILRAGDYTEVQQIVDLTGYDLLTATMETIGKVMGQAQPLPGFPDGQNALWHFNFNTGAPRALNLVDGGFDLNNAGDMEAAVETYSPVLSRCRQVPVNSVTAKLIGENTPQWMSPSPLTTYTFQMWMNFDAVAHPGSSGISPSIFGCLDAGLNGLQIYLAGLFGPGAHEWRFGVGHHNGGLNYTEFPTPVLDAPNPGWQLISIVWDSALPPADRLRLYVNTTGPYTPSLVLPTSPAAPSPGTDIVVADPNLWGQFDEMWLLSDALSASAIADVYNAATVMPSPVDFEWKMQIRINGEVYAERIIEPSERRTWTDFKAPCRHLNGDSEVVFRLSLKEI